MPKLAYLFERFPSFTQTFCYREVVEIRKQGLDPVIYSLRVPADVPTDCPPELTSSVNYLPEHETLLKELKWAKFWGKLNKVVNSTIANWGKRPDKNRLLGAAWVGLKLKALGITHVHTHFAGMGARTAYWMKKFYGINYSFTAHANDVFCYDPELPVTLSDLLQEAAFVVSVTEFGKRWLVERFPQFQDKIHVVYNGLNLEGYLAIENVADKPNAYTPAVPQILSVGRCIEKKGFAVLIDACALLRVRGVPFRCVIVGSGPLEDELKQRVAANALEGFVELVGAKPQGEVRTLLSKTSVFALACATEADGGMDNLPTVIVEAMACGVPVVSTRLAGVPEMVIEGETGLLVNERDVPALADAIETLLKDRAKAKTYAAKAKELARERFATQATTARLKALLSANT